MELAIRVAIKVFAAVSIGFLLPMYLPAWLALILSFLQGCLWGVSIANDIIQRA